jgi:hypothetical protein
MAQVYGSFSRPSPANSSAGFLKTAEEQNVAIGVRNFETAQTVVRVLKRCAECCAMIGKFGSKRIGV